MADAMVRTGNSAGSLPARKPTMVVQVSTGWSTLNLRGQWKYPDLLWILASRDVHLRYKQADLGVVWVVLPPRVAAPVFAVICVRFANLPSDGSPFLLFVLSGLLSWTFFANALARTGNNLISDSRWIYKVYFPRLLIPHSSTVVVTMVSATLAVALAVFIAGAFVFRGVERGFADVL